MVGDLCCVGGRSLLLSAWLRLCAGGQGRAVLLGVGCVVVDRLSSLHWARRAYLEALAEAAASDVRGADSVESRRRVHSPGPRSPSAAAAARAAAVRADRAADRADRDAAGGGGALVPVPISGLAALVERRMAERGESWQVACMALAELAAAVECGGVAAAAAPALVPVRAAPAPAPAALPDRVAYRLDGRRGPVTVMAVSTVDAQRAFAAAGVPRGTFYGALKSGRVAMGMQAI